MDLPLACDCCQKRVKVVIVNARLIEDTKATAKQKNLSNMQRAMTCWPGVWQAARQYSQKYKPSKRQKLI
eukprot:scaffold679852_cov65-Prasinocladus_malaysianus.AAC.1